MYVHKNRICLQHFITFMNLPLQQLQLGHSPPPQAPTAVLPQDQIGETGQQRRGSEVHTQTWREVRESE